MAVLAPTGLSVEESARRLDADGPNELRRDPGPSPVALLLRQFASPLVALLGLAAGVAALVGDALDAAAIAAIVVLNAAVGFAQEHKAEQALRALRQLTAPRARVLRDGRSSMLPAREVVVGNVLVLEAGDVVAADARLLVAHQLTAVEAALTGESVPARKGSEPAPVDAPLAERSDRVFLGTSIATGTGMAEVTATGMRTEMGRIADLLAEAGGGPTPLQVRLAAVSRALLGLCLVVVGAVAAIGVGQGRPGVEVLLASVSLAVAAVPEGLPAVVTIALAVGVRRLASRNVLVRRLPAVETLGAVTVICTDKTGTLTTGRMAVREVWGPDPDAVLRAGAACSDAEIGTDGRELGDPTEVAILRAAAERGVHRAEIERDAPRTRVEPFDADTRRMAVARADGRVYVKGAVEVLVPLSASGAAGAEQAAAGFARRGLRVLGVAVGTGERVEELVFLGLIGLADPPRPEAVAAIAAARRAGIRTVMITGDHPVTATAIARELGVLGPGEAPEGRVFARATPEQKIGIVRELSAAGEIVAMTGDGVNDAPAIRAAHVGAAMGSGTEVTCEAAAVVLTDDDFASVVEGVREGRTIYENIRKTLVYLLSGNVAELLVMACAALLALPLPLLPLHLLWINLVTDGLPALALVTDPPASDGMARPPRPPSEPLLGRAEWGTIALTGALQAAVALGVFWATLDRGEERARALAFTTLVYGELFRAFAARSTDRLFFEVGVFTNAALLGVVGISAALQVALAHVPWTAAAFRLTPPSWSELALAVGLGLVPVSALEVGKLLRRSRRR